MSTYTGRYVRSHGATWNNTPLPAGEWTIGDHLSEIGARAVLCGKTHMTADIEGMQRLGIDPDGPQGKLMAQCGFEVWDRLDGLHPATGKKQPSHYQDYLRAQGYACDNPWEDYANSAEDAHGNLLPGWFMENADKPARIAEEHSETPYATMRAMEFMEQAGDEPFCLHLSYIKPHWPFIAPAPYHNMYGQDDVIPVVRSYGELNGAHPVMAAYQKLRANAIFARDGVREHVIPTYMGLITQIDDQIGRLMAWMEETGRDKDTMIVFTSDHGDYMGDHWMGEKELFHDVSVRVPLIIVDPDAAADGTRGTTNDHLVESIDLIPTFVEWMGGEVRSEVPLLRGQDVTWRNFAFSEYDYSWRLAREVLDVPVSDCRLVMVTDGRWKYVHCVGFDPILFDLENDPDELVDLGTAPEHADVRARLKEAILDWSLQHHNRTTISDADIARRGGTEHKVGIYIGFWDQAEADAAHELGHSGN
jgi:arylsulfatase A-like enzyme